MNKEVNDALHTLLNLSLKDKSFSTQKQQFKIVYDYITNLQEEVKEVNDSVTWWNNRFNTITKEVVRLNNIINELEKWIIQYRKLLISNPDIIEQGQLDILAEILYKIKELKEKK